MAQLIEATYHRMIHVTGPGCVQVSLRFGATPDDGPIVTRRSVIDCDIEPNMDVASYTQEVLKGVRIANEKHGTSLAVEEIEIIPDDFPTQGQVQHCAFTIAEHVITKSENKAE